MSDSGQIEFNVADTAPQKNSMWLALVLSVFTPGLGQFYNGQPLKCLIYYFTNFVILLACSFSGTLSSFAGLLTFLSLTIAWRLFVAADAMMVAHKGVPAERKIPKWYSILAMGIGILLVNAFTPLSALSKHRTFSIHQLRMNLQSLSVKT